jgi:hypothetical protein
MMKIILKKICIFVSLDAGPSVFPKDFFNRNGTSPGPPQRLPWPPCPALPCPCPVLKTRKRGARQVFGRLFYFYNLGSGFQDLDRQTNYFTRCFTGLSLPPPPKTSVTNKLTELIYMIGKKNSQL